MPDGSALTAGELTAGSGQQMVETIDGPDLVNPQLPSVSEKFGLPSPAEELADVIYGLRDTVVVSAAELIAGAVETRGGRTGGLGGGVTGGDGAFTGGDNLVAPPAEGPTEVPGVGEESSGLDLAGSDRTDIRMPVFGGPVHPDVALPA